MKIIATIKRSAGNDSIGDMWQETTGKPHVFPDLGVLLEWFMSQIKRGEEK